MIYFESKNIQVFPSAYRGSYTSPEDSGINLGFDPEAELNTEFNYTHLLGLSGDKDSYVVQWPTEEVDETVCILKGYYFKILGLHSKLKETEITQDGEVAQNEEIVQDYDLAIGLKQVELAPEAGTIENKRTTTILSPLSGGVGGLILDKYNDSASTYEFIGLGLIESDEALSVEGVHEISRLHIASKSKTNNTITWNYKEQVFQSIEEGPGQFAIAQKDAGNALGKNTVILGEGHGDVTSDNAVVIGQYSWRVLNDETGETELFTIGAGTEEAASNALQVKVDKNGNVQTVISDNARVEGDIKAFGNIEANSNIKAFGNVKAIKDVWVGKNIYFGKLNEETASKGSIITITEDGNTTETAEAHNITFPDTPVRDTDPVRLIDLNIDENFFNALYS